MSCCQILSAPQPLAEYIASKGREVTAAALDVTDRKAVEDWAAQWCGYSFDRLRRNLSV